MLIYLTKAFYWDALVLMTFIALIFSIRYYWRHRTLRVFTYYIFFSLLADIADLWDRAYGGIEYGKHVVLNIYYNSFIVFEFLVSSLFILYYVKNSSRRLAIKTTIIVYLAMFSMITFVHVDFLPRIMYIIAESVLLVFPCLIYYYELFVTVTPKTK